MGLIILDTETTGINYFQGDRLVEIGACKYVNRVLVSEFHRYLNPMCPVSLGALKVHGLSDQFLRDKPLFSEVAPDFIDFIAGGDLVIHNAPFDLGFLDNELVECGLNKISGNFKVIDTLLLARKMYPGQKNSLDALCKRLGVDNKIRIKHGALLDAQLLAEVYLIMTASQNAINIQEVSLTNNFAREIETKNYLKLADSDELQGHLEYMRKLLPDSNIDW